MKKEIKCNHRFEIADKLDHDILEKQALVGKRTAIYLLCVNCGMVKVYYIHETRYPITGFETFYGF